MTTFAKRITAARKEKKLTQEQVAQAMGVSRQTVSHWENGRVEPTQEQREALCRLLEIPADAPQPTPLHRRILAAVALAAFVTILVMAVYPIYKSRHAGANPEAAQETPVPQSEKYSWDWFQQPDAQPVEGQAHIELTTAERPLMLTESENEEKPYVWSILLFAQETNGVSFTMEKVTEVYFNNEKLPMQTAEMTANEIEWYWYSTRLEAGGMTSYATDRPADGGIGYGVAVEGKDDNGNELTFKLYIPFSSEIKSELTPEQNPVAITQDAFFQGGKGWFFNVSMQNESDVAFVPESVTAAYFYQEKQQRQVAQPTSAFGFGEMRKGGEPMIYEDAAAYQAFDSVGVMLKGTDANGNALSFTTLVHFSQETNP